ncbi:MAG: hypothetical protein H0T68_14440 [Gemmatimonadales bacterium]|nr:hypothetical protein [Gemmatimonadales bacterium]
MPLTGVSGAAGGGVVAIALAWAAWRAKPEDAIPPAGFLIVNGGLVLFGVILLIAAAVRRRWRRPGDLSTPDVRPRAAPDPAASGGIGRLLGLVLGTGLAALGDQVALVFAGVVLAAWSAWLLQREVRRPRTYPVVPALSLLLIPAYWLLSTIAGPLGLAVSALPAIPLSPAAERLLAAALLLVAWALGGLWPVHRQVAGALIAPAGALLIYRVGAAAMPAGLAYWRAAIFPLLVIGIWHAALARRLELVAVGGGLLGMASLDRNGIAGAGWLLATAVGLEVLRRTGVDGPLARSALIVTAAWGGLEAATGGLRTEVVYTVLAAGGAALGFMKARP